MSSAMVLGRLSSRRVVGLQCMASLESRYSASRSNIDLLGTRNTKSPLLHHPTFASSSSSRRYFSSRFHHEKRFHLGQDSTKRLLSSSAATAEHPDESSSTMNNDNDLVGAEEACRYTLHRRQGVRNVAIIAHVDHGKTTLVDQLLRAAARRTSNYNSNNNNTNAADGGNMQQQNQDNTTDRLMDSGELEKERGITITSKITRVEYVYNNTETMILNIVDTPGHADFCGEVDRILDMVDGVCLVVDAAEGPMTQTKYVLSRALAMHLKPIVVLNKCDRVAALAQLDNGTTENSLKRLFEMLQQHQKNSTTAAASASADKRDDDDNYVTMYASARQGWVTEEDPFLAMELAEQGDDYDKEEYGMHKLLDVIVREIPEPSVRIYTTHAADDDDTDNTTTANAGLSRPANFFASAHPQQPLSMAAVTVGYDPYLGRTCTGRIVSGSVQVGDAVTVLSRLASNSTTGRNINSDASSATASSASSSSSLSSTISGIFVYKGIHRIPFPDTGNGTVIASAGDCVTLAGVPHDMAVGDTLTSLKNPVHEPLSTPPLAPPTLAMDWSANQGPLAGQDGTQIASSKIQQRLQQETDNNVTLSIEPQQEKTVVLARGELQLGILIEQMRREGFEIVISPPRILTYQDEDGQLFEPFEEVTVDVDAEYSGTVVSALTGDRKGILMEMINSGQGDKSDSNDGKSRLIFEVPSRGLLGFHSEIATLTKGSAVVNHVFLEDRPHVGSLHGMTKSKLVSSAQGKATAHALASLAARGTLFIEPGDMVYSGMVIGENSKTNSPDLEVNPVRAKEVTNMRTVNKDEKIHLPPAKKMSVEELIGYMNEDEVLEVTPHHIRLRKALLDASTRERASRNKAKQLRSAK